MTKKQYLSTNMRNQYFIQMMLDTVCLISDRSDQLILISQRETPAEKDNIILELQNKSISSNYTSLYWEIEVKVRSPRHT